MTPSIPEPGIGAVPDVRVGEGVAVGVGAFGGPVPGERPPAWGVSIGSVGVVSWVAAEVGLAETVVGFAGDDANLDAGEPPGEQPCPTSARPAATARKVSFALRRRHPGLSATTPILCKRPDA